MPKTAAPTRGAAIAIRGLCKRYRLPDGSVIDAARSIDLDIQPGTFTALVGASGSGKSTLLHLIGAIDRPDAGEIIVGGRDVARLGRTEAADYRATIGFVFQRFHLLPALTVLDNILAPLVGRKVTFDGHARARDLVAAVGLTGRENSLPSQLSGGQQQRVAIARALIGRPGLVLADEPTGNLDSATARDVINLLRDLQIDRGTTLVMATHDRDVAAGADVVLDLHDGAVTPGSVERLATGTNSAE